MLHFFLTGFLFFLKSAIFLVGYISNNSLFPEPLSSNEEQYYLNLLSEGNEEAKNILIERNLRLVAHVCKKYNSTNIELDDLFSIGRIRLIYRIICCECSNGVRLATYVSRCVDNEILMYLRSIKKLNSEFYLEEPIGKDKDDNTITLQEILESNNRPIEDEVDLKFKIKKLYIKMKEVLKSREKLILELRFGLDGNKPKTQNEIAQMMGISRSYVSRIETKAIGKLAQEIREE